MTEVNNTFQAGCVHVTKGVEAQLAVDVARWGRACGRVMATGAVLVPMRQGCMGIRC
jgi:hypothetical protein